MRAVERWVMLRTIDTHWIEHLTAMEELREEIYLRGYGQQDPLVAYKREAHDFFEQMRARIAGGVAQTIMRVSVRTAEQAEQEEQQKNTTSTSGNGKSATGRTDLRTNRDAPGGNGQTTQTGGPQKLGRNDPCWCGWEEVQEVSRPLAAVLILGAVVSCARGSDDIGGPSTSVPTISPIAAASVAASAGPGILDDRFGYVVGERELKVRSETSDAAITSFVPQGRSWTSLSRTVAPDGGALAYWAPVNDGAVLHVRSAATGADRAVFTAASDMSGNTFAWSSDGTGLVIAIDNNCQEICAVQGGTPKQELWTVDLPTGATEKIATGRYWLPVAWDRTAKLIAAGLTGPGGYLIGYDIIDLRLKPYVSKATGYEPALLGQLRASGDARY